MGKKFISYQDLLLMDISTALPEELREFFVDHVTKCGEISLGEGSLVQTHVDSSGLQEELLLHSIRDQCYSRPYAYTTSKV